MPDLYETLGVDKRASTADVRRAYRKKAKAAHPDAGGTVEAFKQLQIAADVLGDAEKRRRYDATGNVNEPVPDTRDAIALNAIAAALEALMQSRDLEKVDIIATLRGKFEREKDGPRQQKGVAAARAAKLDRVAAKFKRKGEGENLLASIARGKALEARRFVEVCDVELAKLDRCLEILKDYSFVYDTGPQQFNGFAGLAAMGAPSRMW